MKLVGEGEEKKEAQVASCFSVFSAFISSLRFFFLFGWRLRPLTIRNQTYSNSFNNLGWPERWQKASGENKKETMPGFRLHIVCLWRCVVDCISVLEFRNSYSQRKKEIKWGPSSSLCEHLQLLLEHRLRLCRHFSFEERFECNSIRIETNPSISKQLQIADCH